MINKEENGWQTTKSGQKMMETLSEEGTLASITRLLQKMEVIEKSLETLTQAVAQAPSMVAMTADVVDETYAKANEKGIDLDLRIKNLIKLMDQISDPVIVDRLEKVFSTLDLAPGLTATLVDTMDEEIANLDKRGVRVEERLSGLTRILEALSDPKMVSQFESGLQLGAKIPDSMAILGDIIDEQMGHLIADGVDPHHLGNLTTKAMKSLSVTAKSDIEMPGSIFSVLRKLRDPERQKALGFMLSFLKNLGKEL